MNLILFSPIILTLFFEKISRSIVHIFDKNLIAQIQVLDEERRRVLTFTGESYDSIRPSLTPVQRMELEIRLSNIEGTPWPQVMSQKNKKT